MTSLEAQLTLEIAQFQAALAKSQGDVDKWKGKAQRAFDDVGRSADKAGKAGAGKNGVGRNMGQLAMQAQDVAVQLQMGTKMATVLAQQGSQALSAFGAGGAILGGVLAIGGAFYTIGEKAKEAFAEAAKGQRDFNDEAAKVVRTGSYAELFDASEKAAKRYKDQLDEIGKEMGYMEAAAEVPERLTNGVADLMKQFTMGFGLGGGEIDKMIDSIRVDGVDMAEIIAQREELIEQTKARQLEIQQRLVDSSAELVEIENLRLLGDDEKADALEREMKLKQEIAKIDELDATRDVKDQLKADARARSEAKTQTAERKDRMKEAEKLKDAQKKLEEITKKTNEGDLTTAQKITKLRKEMADSAKVEKGGSELERVEAATRQMEKQKELNELLKRQREEEGRILEARKKQAQLMGRAREDYAADLEVARLRAKGLDRQADKLQKQKDIEARARQLQKDLSLSPEEAMNRAKDEAMYADKIKRRKSNGGSLGHIYGAPREIPWKSSLDEFYRNQKRRELMPGEKPPPGYRKNDLVPKFPDSLSGRGTRQLMAGADEKARQIEAKTASADKGKDPLVALQKQLIMICEKGLLAA